MGLLDLLLTFDAALEWQDEDPRCTDQEPPDGDAAAAVWTPAPDPGYP